MIHHNPLGNKNSQKAKEIVENKPYPPENLPKQLKLSLTNMTNQKDCGRVKKQ